MTETSFRAEYAGYLDDVKVAWTYKAYNEIGAPYVLVLSAPDYPALTITQASVDPDGDISPALAEEIARRNAINWVNALTELSKKADDWDEFQAARAEAEEEAEELAQAWRNGWLRVVGCDVCTEDEGSDELSMVANTWLPADFHDLAVPEDVDGPFTVSQLGDDETDAVWEDTDGDQYKYMHGEWCINMADNRLPDAEWSSLDSDESDWLVNYGPYTVVSE